jgi:hypothetical protein
MDRRFEIEGIEIGLPAEHRASHRIAMAANIFGERMDNEVCPEGERAGGNRAGEGRVHHHVSHPLAMSELAQFRDVRQPHDGIGRRFQPQHPGFGPQGPLDGACVRGVDERHVNSETRQ